MQPAGIEAPAHLASDFGQVAAVNAHPLRPEPAVDNAVDGAERVVSVDEQGRVVRKNPFEFAEAFDLVFVRHDERVCECTEDRNAKTHSRLDIRSCYAPADIGRASRQNTRFRSVRASRSEFDDAPPLRSLGYARSF